MSEVGPSFSVYAAIVRMRAPFGSRRERLQGYSRTGFGLLFLGFPTLKSFSSDGKTSASTGKTSASAGNGASNAESKVIPVPILPLSDVDDLPEYSRLTDAKLRRKLEPERGLYLAESLNVTRRAGEAGHEPISFLTAPRWLPDLEEILAAVGAGEHGPIPVYVAEEEQLERLTGFHLHRSPLAAMHRPALPSLAATLEGAGRVAVLEGIVDHTNVGALFRSAAALGIDAVLITPDCADPLYRRSVRVSMGTVFQVPWTRIDPWPGGIEELRALGFTTAALALRADAVSLEDFSAPEKLALILGTEGDGLSARTLAQADVALRIPMSHGVHSLNVAAAAAVAFWATGR